MTLEIWALFLWRQWKHCWNLVRFAQLCVAFIIIICDDHIKSNPQNHVQVYNIQKLQILIIEVFDIGMDIFDILTLIDSFPDVGTDIFDPHSSVSYMLEWWLPRYKFVTKRRGTTMSNGPIWKRSLWSSRTFESDYTSKSPSTVKI